jgi:hypothetical protein
VQRVQRVQGGVQGVMRAVMRAVRRAQMGVQGVQMGVQGVQMGVQGVPESICSGGWRSRAFSSGRSSTAGAPPLCRP